jgi:putative DNA primase/helicase
MGVTIMKKGGEKVMIDWEKSGFFKGFTPTKNASKKPLLAYTKVENHFSLQEMQTKEGFIGILADDVIMLDADTEEASEALLKIIQEEKLSCMVTQRENGRGIHVYFYDLNETVSQNYTGVTLACGSIVDIKIGRRNGYDCLKFNGDERYIIYDCPPYQNIPKFFLPLKGFKENFASMGEGDGRNQALFNYILTLQSHDFTNEETRETIKILNKHILKKPLSEKELNVILRDEAFKKQSFFKGTRFLHDKFAEYLKRDCHVIKLNGQLHSYQGGVYVAGRLPIEKAMVKELPFLTDAKRKETLKQLDIICDSTPLSGVNFIAFKNGIYNVIDKSFSESNPNIVVTNMIPWNYNPAAESELLDTTLDKIACFDSNIRSLLEECIGSCLYRSNTLGGGKAFILTGEGSNGKSTFIDMIKDILGEENIASLDLKELGDRFKTAELFGKLANVGDDISSEYIPNASVFKKLVTGERVNAERKGQDPFEFNNYCKFLFSSNDIPKMGGAKDSKPLRRRFKIIPFDAHFSPDDADHNTDIRNELAKQEHIEYAILLGLKGLHHVLETQKYTDSKKVEEQLEEFEVRNNSVKAFVVECEENDFEGDCKIINEPCSKVYRHYEEFCFRNGHKNVFSRNEFGKQLQRILPVTTKASRVKEEGNKVCKVYVKSVTAS